MTRILVWDAPNMDMQLSLIYGRMPISAERPNMKAVLNWFLDFGEGTEINACVFVNVETKQGSNPKFHGWLRMLNSIGYDIFAKPKATPESDVDADMIEFIQARREGLTQVVIASHDAKCFQELVTELNADSIDVVLLGFSELMNGWSTQGRTFVDLESINNVFRQPLPRHINIFQLPEHGMLFESDRQASHKRIQARTTPLRVNPKRAQRNASTAHLFDQPDSVIELPSPSQEIAQTTPSV